jgi:hypothetical protein
MTDIGPLDDSSPLHLRRRPWYEHDEGRAHAAVMSTMAHLDQRLGASDARFWRHFRLYDQDAAFAARGAARVNTRPGIRLNVVRAAVVAVHAKIAQNKVKPTYLTSGEGYDARQKAQKTQAFVDGVRYHADSDTVGSLAALYALIFGSGHVKTFWAGDGKLGNEAVLPVHIRVDPADGMHREPLCIYDYRPVDRAKLRQRFAGDKRLLRAIDQAPEAPEQLRMYTQTTTDLVAACEAFCRPSAPGADDGRRVLALQNATLVDEPLDHAPPIHTIRWGVRPIGWEGYGIAEQLEDLQFGINELLIRLHEQLMLSGPKIFLERGSAIDYDELTNLIWGFVHYTGAPPQYVVPQAVQPELFEHLRYLYQQAFDEVGISQLAVRSEKPAGLNSGRALMTFSDLESAKFVDFGTRYERLVRDVSDSFLDLVMCADDDEDINVTVPVKKWRTSFLEKVSRAEIVSSRDEFVTQVFPTSSLPQTPAARLQVIGDMQDRGLLPPEAAQSLLNFPDLEAETALMAAPIEHIDWVISRILDHGESLRPEPWENLEMARTRATQSLMRAQMQGVDEERWQRLAVYIDDCTTKIQAAQPPPQPAMPAPAAAPAMPAGPIPGAM